MRQFNNPHYAQPTSLFSLGISVVKNWRLILEMIKQEVVGRYKGSILGLTWSFFNPILMLSIYTFVFSVVFKSRWGSSSSGSQIEFALILFVGMIVFNLFSEVLNRAPTLIVGNVNYVKKVVFPLEVLSIINIGAALFYVCISFAILLLTFFFFSGFINWTVILLPIVLLPLVFLTLGFSFFLASLGVFARDVGHIIGIFTTLLMFLSPVFYPITAVPPKFQAWIMLNPLTFIIEQARDVVIFGRLPAWNGLGIYFIAGLLVLNIGYAWFQKTRKGFSDVL
jgi:lipopolysaccharide transport system permease protein